MFSVSSTNSLKDIAFTLGSAAMLSEFASEKAANRSTEKEREKAEELKSKRVEDFHQRWRDRREQSLAGGRSGRR